MSMGVLIFILAILVVVMVHESGHFVTAKIFGFKAPKFFVGFGPTVWSTTKGETEYGIKALPLGGFVKIAGMNPYEEVPQEDLPRAYFNKPKWQRAIVLFAGSATHFLLAFLILLVAGMTLGNPTGNATTNVAAVQETVFDKPTPAADSPIQRGDKITAVDGIPTDSWNDVRNYIRKHPGDTVEFTYVHGGQTQTTTVTLGVALFAKSGRVVAYAPTDDQLPPAKPGQKAFGFFGISPQPEYKKDSFLGAFGDAGSQVWDLTKRSVVGIGQVFSTVGNGKLWSALKGEHISVADRPIGPVGAGRIAGESIQTHNYLLFINLIVGFIVFVGLMNLLPLPPLDGGHLAVLAFEGVTGRRVDVRRLIPLAAAVISFFVLLFVAVLYLDLARPVRLPF